MADGPELEHPDLDVDEQASGFKRAVAVAVVLITLFGATVAYLQAVESNDEDVAARDAQRDAVVGLGDQVDSSATLAADFNVGSALEVQRQRQVLNAARVNALSGDTDDVHLAAADRFEAVAAALATFAPLDPADPATVAELSAARAEDPDAARLRQEVQADRANDHGGKADAYIAVLTVLAVALFLLGLSLTVQGRSRYVLAAPGVVIALVCVGWSGLIAGRDVTKVSERSVEQAALGARLQAAGDLDGAIEAFDRAIDDSPAFAAAYARRAGAHFVQGSPQTGQTAFTSITSEEALEAALEDLDTALGLGADSDIGTVADAGFFTFLAGDFDRSVQLSTQATELNERLAPVWFNLGVAQVARGDDEAAEDAYREGLQVLEDIPDAGTRSLVLSAARTDLSILREILDDDELEDVLDLVVATEVELAAFEAEEFTCDGEACPEVDDADDAELGDAEFSRTGEDVNVTIPVDGLEPGDAVATAWYFRTDDSVPFEQAFQSFTVRQVDDDGTLTTGTQPTPDPACPVAGEYLVRLYAGGEFLGEARGTIEPSVLGDTFTVFADPIEGFQACVPDGFETSRSDLSDLDSFTTFGAPGQPFLIGVNVLPGALAPGDDPALLLQGVMDTIAPGAVPTPVNMFGTDLDGNLVVLEGLMAIDEADGSAVASAIGPDSSSRVILLTGDVTEEALLEVVGLVTFTGVGTDPG